MNIVVTKPSGNGRHAKLLADVTIHFDQTDVPLQGLKLQGIAVWHTARGLSVTLPSRRHNGGEFELLRATDANAATIKAFKGHVLEEYHRQIPTAPDTEAQPAEAG